MNALLSDDYRITVDSAAVKEMLKSSTLYKCNHCTTDKTEIINKGEESEYTETTETPTEINQTKIKIVEFLYDQMTAMLKGEKYHKVWQCPNCSKINELSDTDIIKLVKGKPYYKRVIGDMPIGRYKLTNRRSWPRDFGKWYWDYFQELEHALGLYRTEYISQNGMDMDDLSAFKEVGGD